MPTLDYLDFINIKFVKVGIGCGCLAGQIIQDRRELILNELFLRILSETIGMPNFTQQISPASPGKRRTSSSAEPPCGLIDQPSRVGHSGTMPAARAEVFQASI